MYKGVGVRLLIWFCNHLDEEKRVVCFAFIVCWMYCYSKCSVAFPRWSAVCGCGKS